MLKIGSIYKHGDEYYELLDLCKLVHSNEDGVIFQKVRFNPPEVINHAVGNDILVISKSKWTDMKLVRVYDRSL